MRACLHSQRGSSAVLIALLMITLVVFGILSLTATASELKMAMRNAESNKDYYALDSEGTRFVADIKGMMEEALIPVADGSEEADFFIRLEQLMERDLPYMRRVRYEENGRTLMRLTKAFALENGGYNKILNITLALEAPDSPGHIDSACSVLEWRLWQEPFEYHQSTELWEGLP